MIAQVMRNAWSVNETAVIQSKDRGVFDKHPKRPDDRSPPPIIPPRAMTANPRIARNCVAFLIFGGSGKFAVSYRPAAYAFQIFLFLFAHRQPPFSVFRNEGGKIKYEKSIGDRKQRSMFRDQLIMLTALTPFPHGLHLQKPREAKRKIPLITISIRSVVQPCNLWQRAGSPPVGIWRQHSDNIRLHLPYAQQREVNTLFFWYFTRRIRSHPRRVR